MEVTVVEVVANLNRAGHYCTRQTILLVFHVGVSAR